MTQNQHASSYAPTPKPSSRQGRFSLSPKPLRNSDEDLQNELAYAVSSKRSAKRAAEWKWLSPKKPVKSSQKHGSSMATCSISRRRGSSRLAPREGRPAAGW